VDAYLASDYQNYAMTTNNEWPVKVLPGDRRYTAFETANTYKGDSVYFSKLVRCLKEEGAAEEFLGYLMRRKYKCPCDGPNVCGDADSPFFNVHEGLWTSEKDDLCILSSESISSYVDVLMNGELEFIRRLVKTDQDSAENENVEGSHKIQVSNAVLYQEYCAYHDRGNFFQKKYDIRAFQPMFRKQMGRYRGRYESIRIYSHGNRQRAWSLDVCFGNRV